MYGKIFDSMYEGTLYGHWQAIVTLQQMLVLCDSFGTIDMTPQAISGKTSIPLEIIAKGIEVLAAPDPYSRTPGEDGVRIKLMDDHRPWGWYIVNHAKYQMLKTRADKQAADRERIAISRNANKNKDVADCSKLSQVVADVAYVDVDVHTDVHEDKDVHEEPKKQVKSISAKSAEKPADVDANIWADFVLLRKTKKAPLTETALKGIERETAKAGISLEAGLRMACERGWQGFKADWVNGSSGHSNQAAGDEAKRLIFGNQEKDITDESERI